MRLKVTISDEEGNKEMHLLHFSTPLVLTSTKEELETRMLRDVLWTSELLFHRYLNHIHSKDKKGESEK